MVKITETSDISEYEKRKLKKEDDFLLIGKNDKTINVVSNGEKISIKELAVANRTGTSSGRLTIPTLEGIPYVIQYGTSIVAPNSTLDVVFTTPFTNRCFQVQATLRDVTDDASTVKATLPSGDNTKFSIKRIGGTVNDTVQWMAFGF